MIDLAPPVSEAPETPAWEAFLAAHFPGYLLPDSARHTLSEDVAARFLERLGGGPDALFVLRAASVLSSHLRDVEAFAQVHLPRFVASLPRGTTMDRRVWDGRLPGRLDPAATLRLRLEGRSTQLVTRTRTDHLDAPESVLVKSVATRIRDASARLRRARGAAASGWSAALPACESALDHLLSRTALRDVPYGPIQCSAASRDPAVALASRLHVALRQGLESSDPASIARAVAAGALAPRDGHTRFELAVLIRLVHALWTRLEPSNRWTLHRALVLPDRREVVDLARDDGAHVRIFYDQSYLDPGAYDRGVRRYFNQRGRLRPDVTVTVEIPDRARRAVVIEAKMSADPGYLAAGYQEALLYHLEYGPSLTGWPRAILVTSSPVLGAPSRDDDAIAIGWDRWVPDVVLDGLLEGL